MEEIKREFKNLVKKTRKREKTNFEWLVSNAISVEMIVLVSYHILSKRMRNYGFRAEAETGKGKLLLVLEMNGLEES